MKKSIFLVVPALIVTGFLFHSCTKNNNGTGNVANVYSSMNQMFAALRSTPQNLTVTAGQDVVVIGNQGTRLHFYPNSFKDATGAIIRSGTINIQLTEVYTPGDMIANRTSTMANGQLLLSSGEININATMNGNNVYANNYGVAFIHPRQSTAQMALFSGGNNNTDSMTTWAVDTGVGKSTTGTQLDTIPGWGKPCFFFDSCNNFSWANCDWFYNSSSPLTSANVAIPGSFSAQNTQLYLVLKGVTDAWSGSTDTFTAVIGTEGDFSRGAAAFNPSTNTMTLMSEGKTAIVPPGVNYELVVISKLDSNYYYYSEKGTIPNSGINTHAMLVQQTVSQIKSALSAL